MALTVSDVDIPQVFGSLRARLVEIDFDDSYPTGGEAIDFGNHGFETVFAVFIASKGGYTFEYDETNEKVLAYWVDTTVDGAALAEVADTTDLSAVTGVKALVLGR